MFLNQWVSASFVQLRATMRSVIQGFSGAEVAQKLARSGLDRALTDAGSVEVRPGVAGGDRGRQGAVFCCVES
jgi:hypothetical protein